MATQRQTERHRQKERETERERRKERERERERESTCVAGGAAIEPRLSVVLFCAAATDIRLFASAPFAAGVVGAAAPPAYTVRSVGEGGSGSEKGGRERARGQRRGAPETTLAAFARIEPERLFFFALAFLDCSSVLAAMAAASSAW